jgi:hypothetical protein
LASEYLVCYNFSIEIGTRVQLATEKWLAGIEEVDDVKYGEYGILSVPIALPALQIVYGNSSLLFSSTILEI